MRAESRRCGARWDTGGRSACCWAEQVLLRPDAVPEPPPPPSAAAQGLTREIDFHGKLDAPFEVFLLFPSVRQNLNAVVNVGTLYSTTAQLPSAPLHFTAAP